MPKQKLTKRADGRLSKQIYLGRDENGKRIYKTVYGKTQKEVEQKKQEVLSQLSRGLDVSSQNNSFKEWSDRFIENKKATISYRSAIGIESLLKHFTPLYDMPVTKIRPHHIESILKKLAQRDNRPLSKKTLTDLRNVAYGVFQLCVKNRIIDFNPASIIDVPNGAGKTKREAITDEQIEWINNTPHNAQTAAMIMLYSGLRRGELIALTWSDVDLMNKTILVNKAVEFINNTPKVKPMTKTQAGMRLISIPDILVTYLKKINRTSVFVCSLNGNMMTEGSFRRMWESYMNVLNEKYGDFSTDILSKKKNGTLKSRLSPGGLPMKIEAFTPHQLRHTYASMLYKSGVDVLTAKDQLGHSDIKTTLNIYTHLDSIYKKRSMEQLNNFIEKSS